MRQETRTRKKYAAGRVSRARVQRQAESSENGAGPEMTSAEWAADQERHKVILAGLFARAQALVPDSPDSPTRKACRESPLDEIIVEKFRRQGFNLEPDLN